MKGAFSLHLSITKGGQWKVLEQVIIDLGKLEAWEKAHEYGTDTQTNEHRPRHRNLHTESA